MSMSDQKDQNDQEMVKLGVQCHCANGVMPKEEELTKTGEAGLYRCPCCGRDWRRDTNTAEK